MSPSGKPHSMTEAEKIADEKFADSSRFEKVANVCVFAEHEKEDLEGNIDRYDRDIVQQMAETANKRITDSHTFSKIVDGHTPPPEDKETPQPAVVGFYGAARVANLPDGRAGIFMDEYRLKTKVADDYFLTHPGRSVEMWMYPEAGSRLFDPIAALGAKKAKLDLPMTFGDDGRLVAIGTSGDGVKIAKYSDAGAPCYPGPTNSFLPAAMKKERYDEMDLAALIEQTVMAVLTKCQLIAPQAVASPAAPGAAPGAAPAPAAAPAADPAAAQAGAPGAAPPEAAAAQAGAAGAAGAEEEREEEDEDPEKKKDQYNEDEEKSDDDEEQPNAEGGDGDEEYDDRDPAMKATQDDRTLDKEPEINLPDGDMTTVEKPKVEKQSAELAELRFKVSKYEAEGKRNGVKIQRLEADNVNAQRFAELAKLQSDGYIFRSKSTPNGVEKDGLTVEMERCRYGAMSDEQFASHKQVIVENYAHSDMPTSRIHIPGGVPYSPPAREPDEATAQAIAVEARQRVERCRAEGKVIQYQDALNDVRKERKLAPVA